MDNAFGVKGKDGQWLVVSMKGWILCDSLKSAYDVQTGILNSVIYVWKRSEWLEYLYQ
jgi:hypothetical protein